MDIVENIKDSAMYPLSEIKNLAIFILILLSCILIVTIPLFCGYIYRMIKESSEDNDVLPEFDDLGQMYIDGLKYIGAGLIYGVVVGIIIVILITIGTKVDNSVIFILTTIMSVLSIFVVFAFEIAASFNMIYNDDFGAAFDFATIITIIQNIGIGNYLIWFIAFMIIGGIVNGIGNLFSWTFAIPLILNGWLYCFQSRSIALLFAYE